MWDFEAVWSGLTQLLTLRAFGFLLLGTLIGMFVGLLPGLGTALAFAILLPFVFGMTPVEAFALLLGMHAVANLAGENTAVLFAVPGQRSAAASILDGYPLTKQGQAGRALGITLMASLLGGIFGAVVLVVAIPIVRPVVLAFGQPQLFMLIMLAVLFVASISGSRLLPGLIAGGIGFLLGVVGADPTAGVMRYTAGQLWLWDGFPIIPLALGLFAIPEIIQLSIKRTSIAENGVGGARKIGDDLGKGIRDVFRHWKLTLQCSGIGAVLGMIPGVGSSATQWIVYGWAKERSKEPEMFGKGSVEGVIAPGSSTNADEGGALVTTVAFGVPGSLGMALLLAAFVIVGIQPGPSMLRENLDVTFSLVWILLFSHIIAVGLFLLFVKQLVRLTYLRATLIVPFILSLVFVGGYASSLSMRGVWLTLAMGVLGYLMVLLGWPRPPLLLAYVLAPLAERYLWLTLQAHGFRWLRDPIVLTITTIMAAYVAYQVRQRRKARTRRATAREG